MIGKRSEMLFFNHVFKFKNYSPKKKKIMLIPIVFELSAKIWSAVHVLRLSHDRVIGSKPKWLITITCLDGGGLLYQLFGYKVC